MVDKMDRGFAGARPATAHMNPRTQDPIISVVIPCYNGGGSLAECVQSVLQQNVPTEIIVVDDGSMDDSLERARALQREVAAPMLVVAQTNQGPAVARNAGLRLARGKYVCFLDVDDQYAPGFFAGAIQVLDSDPAAVAMTCAVELVNAHRKLEPWQQQATESSLPGNIVVLTEVARRMGGFPVDAAFRGPAAGEDAAFRQQLFKFGKVLKVEEPLFRYHVKPGGHLDFFLDRAVLQDGQIQFKSLSPQEQDGSLAQAQRRYFKQAQNRSVDQTMETLRSVMAAGVQFAKLGPEFEKVDGFLQPIEGFALYWLARHWPAEGASVEIGSFKGRSTCWLASACKQRGRGKVVAVDHFRGSPEHQPGGTHADPDVVAAGSTLPVFRRNIEAHGLTDWVDVRVGSSAEVSRGWQEPIRLLFIDGDHSYDATSADFNAWARFMVRWGLVIFHDVRVWPGVTEFYSQLTRDPQRWREVLRVHSLGAVARIA